MSEGSNYFENFTEENPENYTEKSLRSKSSRGVRKKLLQSRQNTIRRLPASFRSIVV